MGQVHGMYDRITNPIVSIARMLFGGTRAWFVCHNNQSDRIYWVDALWWDIVALVPYERIYDNDPQ